VNDIAFFDDNRRFIVVTASGRIVIFDFSKKIEIFNCNIGRAIVKIEIDEESKIIILGEHNGQIHFLKIQNESN
jgi:tricorn protease-like protein